jgi:hypothetical protein
MQIKQRILSMSFCYTVSVTKNLTSLKNKKKKRKHTNVTSKKWLIKLPDNGSKHSSPCVVEVSLDQEQCSNWCFYEKFEYVEHYLIKWNYITYLSLVQEDNDIKLAATDDEY